MGCILKFRSPNLYAVIIVIKKKKKEKKKERIKAFVFFMTMLSFKQVLSNHGSKDPCKRGRN